MASFEDRGTSCRAVVYVNKKKVARTFDSRPEAEAWAARVESGPSPAEASRRTVADLLETYLDAVGSKSDSARWNTLRLMKWAVSPIGREKLSSITTHRMNQWMGTRAKETAKRNGVTRPISGSTINREMNLWAAAFTYGVKSLKWLEANPAHGASRPAPSPARDRPLLTQDEIRAIVIAGGYQEDSPPVTKSSRAVAGFLFALETGMRSGEILRLRPADFNVASRVVKVTALDRGGRKGSQSGQVDSSRSVPLTARATALLSQLLGSMPQGQIATELMPRPPYIVGMNDRDRDAIWRKVRRMSGVPDLTFHDTKHEACTRLARFLDVFELSHAVGTKDIALLRDTYYVSNAVAAAKRLPDQLTASA